MILGGQDKAQHFLASAMLSAAGNEYAQHQGYSRDRSAAIGFMFSVSLGASKELWDSRPSGERLELEKILHGMWQVPLPAMRYGSWHISNATNVAPCLYDAASGRPEGNRAHDGHVPVKGVLNSR